jgi:hypothetical protein
MTDPTTVTLDVINDNEPAQCQYAALHTVITLLLSHHPPASFKAHYLPDTLVQADKKILHGTVSMSPLFKRQEQVGP